MSRPRKPFGATHPGRLPATMMKVLAAEMSDPGRLRKGKQYARDGSVLDIVVERGIVTCEVQGSRPTPYIAAIEVTAGDGMPLRRDVATRCTCPDDDNWDGYSCKHAIAAMYCFSDELLLEPELLDVWRGVARGQAPPDRSDSGGRASQDEGTADDRPSRRHLRLVGGGREPGPDREVSRAETRPVVDPLAELVARPAGASLPAVPDLAPREPVAPREPRLAAVLRDALAHARVDWD